MGLEYACVHWKKKERGIGRSIQPTIHMKCRVTYVSFSDARCSQFSDAQRSPEETKYIDYTHAHSSQEMCVIFVKDVLALEIRDLDRIGLLPKSIAWAACCHRLQSIIDRNRVFCTLPWRLFLLTNVSRPRRSHLDSGGSLQGYTLLACLNGSNFL